MFKQLVPRKEFTSARSFSQLFTEPTKDYSRMVKRLRIFVEQDIQNTSGAPVTLPIKDYAHDSQITLRSAGGPSWLESLSWQQLEVLNRLKKNGYFNGFFEVRDVTIAATTTTTVTWVLDIFFEDRFQSQLDDFCPSIAQLALLEVKFAPTLPAGLVLSGNIAYTVIAECQDFNNDVPKTQIAPVRRVRSQPMSVTSETLVDIGDNALLTFMGVVVKDKTSFDTSDLVGPKVEPDSGMFLLQCDDINCDALNGGASNGLWGEDETSSAVGTAAAGWAAPLVCPGPSYEVSELKRTSQVRVRFTTNGITSPVAFIVYETIEDITPDMLRRGLPQFMDADAVMAQSAPATKDGKAAPDRIRRSLPRKVYLSRPTNGIRA
jgi:hypothetical protein